VSNEVGAGNVDRAKNAVAVTMKLSVLLAVSFVLLLAFGHGVWARLFSGSAVIVSEFAAITPLMIVSVVLDSAQGVLEGESSAGRPAISRRRRIHTGCDVLARLGALLESWK
jgi:MATE family multidrug resistance protein